MNRNIAKQFTTTLSLLDVASDRTHKYKCFHGEDIQLTVNVVGENNRLIDLSNTSVKIYFILDKNVNEPVYRQDTGIVVDNLGIITVMLEKSYIRIGNNTLKIVLYDEDQTVFLQPLIISCIDPLIGEVADLEIPDDIDVRDELYDIRRIIGDLQDFDDDLGREIIEARNEHGPMRERLDNFDSQLDEKANKNELNLLSFNRYGEIVLPSDFYNNIDFRIYRSVDGKINHNFNIDNVINGWRTIYISEDGNDANNGDTQEKPKKTMGKVFDKINSLNEKDIIIKILSPVLTRDNTNVSISNRIINKNIAIVSDTEANIGSIETQLSWTKNGNCYQTTRSAVTDVWDKKNRDFANRPVQYKKVSTLAECQNTKGSWCLEETTLYVRRLDDLAIDADIMVLLQTGSLMFDLQSDVKLIFKNVNFLCAHDLNPNVKIYSSQNRGHYIGVNANYLGSQTMNGLQVENVKHCWNFNCSAIGTFRDGFNYHNYLGEGKSSFAFEYNCIAYNNGVRDTVNTNNNAFTAHDGYRLLRIGNIGFNTKGPVLADVNACYSINYDCTMYDSILSGTPSIKTAYWFDDSGVTEETTQAYLINCSGGGKETKGINTDGTAKVNVHNFKGNKVNTSVLNYLE